MTKIPQKPTKWPKYLQNLYNEQNTPQNLSNVQNIPKTQKMTKIPLKPKNNQNTLRTQKMIKIPPNPKNWPKYPPKPKKLYILCFPFLSMGLTWAMGSVFLLGFQLGVNGLFTFDELMCGYDNDTIYIVKQPAH